MGDKLLNGAKSMYVYRVKHGESECFRIDSSVQQGCIMTSWFFNTVYGCSHESDENGDGEDGSKISGGEEKVEIIWPLVGR